LCHYVDKIFCISGYVAALYVPFAVYLKLQFLKSDIKAEPLSRLIFFQARVIVKNVMYVFLVLFFIFEIKGSERHFFHFLIDCPQNLLQSF